jgi:uncharacterized surface protein with fasciclin (FAS1) repeats
MFGFALEANGAVSVDHPGVWSPHSVEGVSKMVGRMSRGLFVAVLALTFSGWAAAQEPKKPEAKPEAKPAMKRPEMKPLQERKEGKDALAEVQANARSFAELVKVAGLDKELQGPAVTVFAPSDEALKTYPGFDDLKKDKAKAADFVKGYVVHKKVDVKVDKTAKPLEGPDIVITHEAGKTEVNGKKVTKDLVASNGAVHVIDGVFAHAAHRPEMKKEAPKPMPAPAPKPEPKEGE